MMSKDWKGMEPSPIEYFHSELLKEFHKNRGNELAPKLSGYDLNKLIVTVKNRTYEKYKSLELDLPVDSDELRILTPPKEKLC